MSGERGSAVRSSVLLAACSALAFGATTPLIASIGDSTGPLVTASLLHRGAALISLVFGRDRIEHDHDHAPDVHHDDTH